MNSNFVWFNRSLPQTLVNAQMLLYITAFFMLLGGAGFGGIGVLFLVGMVGGAAGVANEKKWGYLLAVVTAGLLVLLQVAFLRFHVLRFPNVISFMFDVALLALLVHPQSRDYQRVWFK